MMLKRLTVIAAALTATAVIASACGTTGGGGGKSGGTFTAVPINQINESAPVNPFADESNTFAGYNSMQLAWAKNDLTDPNQFYPGLAKSWTVSSDNSELTIKLQPKAKWSDGKPVTAKDIQTSVNIAYTRATGAFVLSPGAAGTASEVEIVDNKTIKFTQDKTNPSNTFVRGIMELTIVPDHVFGKQIPADFAELLKTARGDDKAAEKAREEVTKLSEKVAVFKPKKDVSAGPFVLKRVSPSEALLVRNKHFYDAAKVAPDNVVLKNFSGNEDIWDMLKAGDVDAAPFTAVPTSVVKQILAKSGNKLSKSHSPVSAALAFNQSKAPYGDIRVRRAFAFLLDKAQATKRAGVGSKDAPTTTGIHGDAAKVWLGDELDKLEQYDTDEAKAEAELKAAGFTKKGGKWYLPGGKPWKVTIQVVNGFSDWIAAGQNIVTQLKEFGIEAETKTTADFTIYQEDIAKGKFDVGFWLIALGPSSYNIYQRIYGQTYGYNNLGGKSTYSAPGKNGNWMGGPKTVKVDGKTVEPGALAQSLQNAKPDAEKQTMIELAKVTNQQLPVIQMWDYVNAKFYNESRWTGWPPDSGERSEAQRLSAGQWIGFGWIKKK